METTEAEAMKDVMNLLETEPPSESDHREQLAILVASGNCKEFLGFNLPMSRNILNVMRLLFHQRLATQLLIHLFNSVVEV